MMTEKAAAVSAGVSVTSASVSWYAQHVPEAQFFAAIIAIISGLAATLYYLRKLLDNE